MPLSLSETDKQILIGLSNGGERKEIASQLGIALSTVHNRIYDAIRRNDLRTSYQLLAWFVRESVLAAVEAQDGASDPD